MHAWIERIDLWMFSTHAMNMSIEVIQSSIIGNNSLFIVRQGFLRTVRRWNNCANVIPVKPAGHWQWFGLVHTPSFKHGESQTGDEQSFPDQPLSHEHLKIKLIVWLNQFSPVHRNKNDLKHFKISHLPIYYHTNLSFQFLPWCMHVGPSSKGHEK